MTLSGYEVAPYADLSHADGKLNVHAFEKYTKAHGPADQAALWLQGCRFRCPGCINQHMLDENTVADLKTIAELTRTLLEYQKSVFKITGLVVMGGEPLLQAKNLWPLLKNMQENDLYTLIYTGYTQTELETMPESVQKCLKYTDTIVTGQFEASLYDNQRLPGSTNQKIIHLTNKLANADFNKHGQQQFLNISGIKTETGIKIRKK